MHETRKATVVERAEAPANRTRVALASLIAASMVAACAATGSGGSASAPVEPRAGTWKTWVIASATEIRVPAPPDTAATAAELAELQRLAAARDAATLERIRYWDAGSPAYRWNELAIETSARNNTTSVPGARAFTLMSVAIDDALVTAWSAKYAYNRPRPGDADSGVTAAVATPRSPSYPSEHAVVAGAASVVLAYIWPKDAERFAALAEQAAQSRVAAGVQYPSDAKAGSSSAAPLARGWSSTRGATAPGRSGPARCRPDRGCGRARIPAASRKRRSGPGCSLPRPSCGRLRRPLPTPLRAPRRSRK